jgi:hypothetical protein
MLLNPLTGSGDCNVFFNTTGHKTLTATYSGDLNYAPSSGTAEHIVVKGSTTTTITADTPDPSIATHSVAVSFTVTGAGFTPTGTVAISGADINCSIALSGGAGTCNVVFNTINAPNPPKTITATYGGDSNYLPSTDTEPHTVKNESTTVITSDNNDASTPGEAITVCFTVSGAGPVPTGNVTITTSEGGPYGSVGLDGAGKGCIGGVIYNTAGAKILTATYDGDGNYVGSVDTESHTVSKGVTTTYFISINPPSSTASINTDTTVTVGVHGGGVPPTGSIGISVDGLPTATCTIAPLSPTGLHDAAGDCVMHFDTHGNWTVTATYSGDGNYYTSFITTSYIVLTPP